MPRESRTDIADPVAIGTRVSAQTWKRVGRLAVETETSRSAVVEAALDEYLARKGY